MVDVISLRRVLRTGILNKSLDTLRNAAGDGSPTAQVEFLKVIYAQSAHTYNTYAGTMLTQLGTLSYLESVTAEPRGARNLDNKKELGGEFTVLSQDNLLARRLLLSHVIVPDMKGIASAEALISFSAEKQAEETERDKKEILRLQGELELLKTTLQKEIDKAASSVDRSVVNLDATIQRLQEVLKPAKGASSKNTGSSQGVGDAEGGDPPEKNAKEPDDVVDKAIMLAGETRDEIEWK
jgi:hypothetical protein